MEKEKFNPKDEKYKEVVDLPSEHQEEFMDVKGGGFVSREAIINREKAEEMAREEEVKREEKIEAEKKEKIDWAERIAQKYPEINQEMIDLILDGKFGSYAPKKIFPHPGLDLTRLSLINNYFLICIISNLSPYTSLSTYIPVWRNISGRRRRK